MFLLGFITAIILMYLTAKVVTDWAHYPKRWAKHWNQLHGENYEGKGIHRDMVQYIIYTFKHKEKQLATKDRK